MQQALDTQEQQSTPVKLNNDHVLGTLQLRRLPDNFIDISGSLQELFVAWSDGRFNIPQPFAAHQGVK